MNTVKKVIEQQHAYFLTGKTKHYSWRIEQLSALENMLHIYNNSILNSLYKDLRKPPVEAYSSEIATVISDIRYARKKLHYWMNAQKVHSPLINFFAKSIHSPQPFGTVLIIGPWNYPFGLLFQPLAAAFAAGNCAILKPSEYAPASSALVKKMFDKTFDKHTAVCIEGNAKDTSRILNGGGINRVFFTGGSVAGRKVMESCARNLIPVDLELGGCNPCIVDQCIPVKTAARRIAWGKFFNAGQTCIAPNVCYIHENIRKSFTHSLIEIIDDFYGSNPQKSSSFARIVNESHFIRIKDLFNSSSGKTIKGGIFKKNDLFISPTLIEIKRKTDILLREEIFGPVLPLVYYSKLSDVLNDIQNKPSPLCVFVFTQNKQLQKEIRYNTRSGNLCINGTLDIVINNALPFGGVGESGMGRYHGKAGFDAFSYRRSEVKKTLFPDIKLTYPPYKMPLWIMKHIAKTLM